MSNIINLNQWINKNASKLSDKALEQAALIDSQRRNKEREQRFEQEQKELTKAFKKVKSSNG
jgi:hypothetical protein